MYNVHVHVYVPYNYALIIRIALKSANFINYATVKTLPQIK